MPLTRIFGFGLSMVMIVTVFSSVGSAQIKRPLRWLGEGFSDGYHQCAPGPNSDYYNPYSAHNSELQSQFSTAYPHNDGGFSVIGSVQSGAPYSAYSVPPSVDNSLNYKVAPANGSKPSFLPIQRNPKPAINNDWRPFSKNDGNPASTLQLKDRFGQRSSNSKSSIRFSILNR